MYVILRSVSNERHETQAHIMGVNWELTWHILPVLTVHFCLKFNILIWRPSNALGPNLW